MAKPAWGKKRVCVNCGARFYDMKKNPATCPKCGTEDNLQPLLKPRRTPTSKPAALQPKAANDDAEETDIPDDIDDVEVDEEEEDGLLVDDDLDDEGDDDVSAVKEHIEPSGEKE